MDAFAPCSNHSYIPPGVHSLLEVVVAWSISILTLAASLAVMSYTDPTACSHQQTSISSAKTPQDMVGQHYWFLKSQSFAQAVWRFRQVGTIGQTIEGDCDKLDGRMSRPVLPCTDNNIDFHVRPVMSSLLFLLAVAPPK